MSLTKAHFGTLPDGRESSTFTLVNQNNMKVVITDFGGAITELHVPDRDGVFSDVVCGYDLLDDYIRAGGYQGAIIGRFANRISQGVFSLDRQEYRLAANNGKNHLHGGVCGFSHKLWDAKIISDDEEPTLRLSYTSPDGEEGYPGELSITVTYKLEKSNSLLINYRAKTDKKTIFNPTNHTYFNLGGFASGKIHNHTLKLDAETYLPADSELIPTGEIKNVAGTPFDFRRAKAIGRDIDSDNHDLRIAGGYDHCLNFYGGAKNKPVLRGVLFCPDTGRAMSLYTDRPSLQLYTANFMTEKDFPLKGGLPQEKQTAVCLETQCMPDSINNPAFTDCVLNRGETFISTTIYKFTVKK